MTIQDKQSLRIAIKKCADIFSNPDREKNYSSETYKFKDIEILSAKRALVIYEKSPSGRYALADFIHLDREYEPWIFYLVAGAHMLNLDKIQHTYQKVEQHNFWT
jgi:hypothetical protein